MASRYLISRSVLLNGRLSQPLGSVAHTQRCLQPALPSTVHLQSYSGISSELLPIQIQHSGNRNKLTCLTVFPRSHTNRFFHESSVKCTEEKTKFSQIPKSPIEADSVSNLLIVGGFAAVVLFGVGGLSYGLYKTWNSSTHNKITDKKTDVTLATPNVAAILSPVQNKNIESPEILIKAPSPVYQDTTEHSEPCTKSPSPVPQDTSSEESSEPAYQNSPFTRIKVRSPIIAQEKDANLFNILGGLSTPKLMGSPDKTEVTFIPLENESKEETGQESGENVEHIVKEVDNNCLGKSSENLTSQGQISVVEEEKNKDEVKAEENTQESELKIIAAQVEKVSTESPERSVNSQGQISVIEVEEKNKHNIKSEKNTQDSEAFELKISAAQVEKVSNESPEKSVKKKEINSEETKVKGSDKKESLGGKLIKWLSGEKKKETSEELNAPEVVREELNAESTSNTKGLSEEDKSIPVLDNEESGQGDMTEIIENYREVLLQRSFSIPKLDRKMSDATHGNINSFCKIKEQAKPSIAMQLAGTRNN